MQFVFFVELVGSGMVIAFGAVTKVKVGDGFSATIAAAEGLGKFTDISCFSADWVFG